MMFGRKLATGLSVVVVVLGASAMTAGPARAWDPDCSIGVDRYTSPGDFAHVLTLRARVTLDPVDAATTTATPA